MPHAIRIPGFGASLSDGKDERANSNSSTKRRKRSRRRRQSRRMDGWMDGWMEDGAAYICLHSTKDRPKVDKGISISSGS